LPLAFFTNLEKRKEHSCDLPIHNLSLLPWFYSPAVEIDPVRSRPLAAIVAYQVLLRYNYRQGGTNGQVKWILDTL
jgi:hypothetical protein